MTDKKSQINKQTKSLVLHLTTNWTLLCAVNKDFKCKHVIVLHQLMLGEAREQHPDLIV